MNKILTKSENKGNFLDIAVQIKGINDDGTFEGYGSVFDTVDRGGDQVLKGAFERSLKEHKKRGTKVKMLWQHSPEHPIGVWDSIKEDENGLYCKGQLLIKNGVPKADEAYALLKSGAIDGLSIGYGIYEGGASYDPRKNTRYLKSLILYEVSLVTFPMNESATVDKVKSIGELIPEEITRRTLEAALRDAGASKATATYVAANFSEPALRDAGGEQKTQLEEVQKALGLLLEGLNQLKGLIHEDQK